MSECLSFRGRSTLLSRRIPQQREKADAGESDTACSPLREERDKGALGTTRPTSDTIHRPQAPRRARGLELFETAGSYLRTLVLLGLIALGVPLTAQETPASTPTPDLRGPRPFGTYRIDEFRARDGCVWADPATQTYHLYFASRGPNRRAAVVAYTSKDLEMGTGPHVVFERPEEWWADRGIWAPEMHAYNGKYYLFLTFDSSHEFPEQWRNWRPRVKRASQVLVSDSPMGPFEPFANKPTLPEDMMTLDGTLFVEDGVPYMVFCHEWVQIKDGTVNSIQLTPDLSATVGEPVRLFHGSDAPWSKKQEPHGCHVTDGPWFHRTESGKLLMLWSSFTDTGYAVGIATSESGKLAGPWKQSPTPIFDDDGGHPMLFRTFDGRLMMAIHQPNETPHERERFIELREDGDTLVLASP
jgi:arabinan endo-1,5-alpha-L-arabinosidase